ncbi:MAG: helicase-associated domain-containing protein, partial [Spirochaetales bacterium]|nr:helicase-associated domain-containing protein [Spirochaetales bacterium]
MQDKPLIVQSDRTLMLDVHSPSYNDCRDQIIAFSELVKAPEHVHTYNISAISLWNAASASIGPEEILSRLERWSKFSVPASVSSFIIEQASRYGKLVLCPNDEQSYTLEVSDPFIAKAIASDSRLSSVVKKTSDPSSFEIAKYDRGT